MKHEKELKTDLGSGIPEAHPLKQGLKRTGWSLIGVGAIIPEAHPLKQGLKLDKIL